MIMKKAERLLLFKVFTCFFVICNSPVTSYAKAEGYSTDFHGNDAKFQGESKKVKDLSEDQEKLRGELIDAHIIRDVSVGDGDFAGLAPSNRSKPTQLTPSFYVSNDSSRSIAVKVFKAECLTQYDRFKPKLKVFISRINCNPDKGSCSVNYNDNIPTEIDQHIIDCMRTIRKKKQNIIDKFVKPILANYDNYSDLRGSHFNLKINSDFSKNIMELQGRAKNFNKIKNEINEYFQFEDTQFEDTCLGTISKNVDCFFQSHNSCESEINSFKAFSDDWTSQNCKDRFKRFNDFADGDLFKKFIALAETDCKDEDSLKASSNSACKKTVGWLKPEYPDEDNELNLFQQCQIEIDKAYKECFGEQGKRTDLQELLYLIDQKSPAVCDNNRISRARPALQNCLNAVNKCSKACNNQITAFKEDFLQCFFLPNFKEADKEPNSMIVHKNTPCKNRITDLKKSFKTQSKAEPFKIKQPSFRSLDLQGSQSLGYQIAKACEKPLDERQLEKKQAEMIQVCRQNPNSRQPLIAPAVGVNPSSNNNSTGAKSSSGDNSRSFSYGGSNNNQGFNFNNNLPQDEKQGPENSPFSYDGPTDDPSNTSKSKKDTNSVSANFDNKHEDSTGSLSPLGLSDSSSSSKRKTASQGSLTGAEDSSKEEIEGKSEESIMDKADTVIRNYLSSDEQYGIIDEDPQPQSTTQRFFNWMNDKKRKTKKALLKAYDGAVGIDREEFKRRLHLNSEHVNLFELQRDLLIKACEIHNCDGRGASPEVQSQIQQQHRQNQQRKPSAQ